MYGPVGSMWIFSKEQACNEMPRAFAAKSIAEVSMTTRPIWVYDPSIYQMLSPQVHFGYQSSISIEHALSDF